MMYNMGHRISNSDNQTCAFYVLLSLGFIHKHKIVIEKLYPLKSESNLSKKQKIVL